MADVAAVGIVGVEAVMPAAALAVETVAVIARALLKARRFVPPWRAIALLPINSKPSSMPCATLASVLPPSLKRRGQTSRR